MIISPGGRGARGVARPCLLRVEDRRAARRAGEPHGAGVAVRRRPLSPRERPDLLVALERRALERVIDRGLWRVPGDLRVARLREDPDVNDVEGWSALHVLRRDVEDLRVLHDIATPLAAR